MYKFGVKFARGIFSSFLKLVVYLAFLAGSAIAAEFSANLVFMTEGITEYGKISATNEKIMMKMGDFISIARMDKNVMWLVMPKGKMYLEMPLELQNIFVGTDKIQGELERKSVGEEMVDGKNTNKYWIKYLLDNKIYTAFLWMLPGVDIPVKKAAEDGNWVIKYNNIYVGKQADDLFEIPLGYQKFDTNMQSLSDTGGIFGEKEQPE